jgi:hypothetical protein
MARKSSSFSSTDCCRLSAGELVSVAIEVARVLLEVI